MRILRYTPEKLYRNDRLVDYLADNLNNAAESATDNNGIYVGSAMKSSLLWERKMFTWVCWEAGVPVGWATLTPRRSEPQIFGVSLYVNRDFRKQGIASAIMKKIITFAEAHEIELVAQPWNPAGEKFYKKHNVKYTPYWDSSYNSVKHSLNESFLAFNEKRKYK